MMRFAVLVACLPFFLGSCCGFRIDYQGVEYAATSSEPEGWGRGRGYLRVFFSSPDNLARTSANSGLMCLLEFPGTPQLRATGYVYRDLRSPVWRSQLAYQPWHEPSRYDFYAEVDLEESLTGQDFGDGRLVVFSPGTFVRCPCSNEVVVPHGDLIESLPN